MQAAIAMGKNKFLFKLFWWELYKGSSHLFVAPALAISSVTTTVNFSLCTYVMSLFRLDQGTCLLCKMNWVYKMASFVNQFNIGTTAIVSQGALKNYE